MWAWTANPIPTAPTNISIVGKAGAEIQPSVFDGMRDEIHDLAENFGLFPAEPSYLFLIPRNMGSHVAA
jgi:hypothetical protein